ncbi:transcription factor [Pseudogymnoascus australis]
MDEKLSLRREMHGLIETYLKKNREAAYKCRMKKKTQTEEVVERVKALGEDNRVKSVEVERLRRELEGLRGLLLSHYRVCGDALVVAYLDGLGGVGGWGVGGGAGMRGGHAGLRGGEGSEPFGAEQEMGVEDADNEEERDEHRRRESEEMEISAASGSGASFDSGVAPVVEGMVGEEPLEMVM